MSLPAYIVTLNAAFEFTVLTSLIVRHGGTKVAMRLTLAADAHAADDTQEISEVPDDQPSRRKSRLLHQGVLALCGRPVCGCAAYGIHNNAGSGAGRLQQRA